MKDAPIISFKDFTFKYTAQAEPTLKNISLDIYKGEKVLICGPSGCGKSTLTHTLNGLIPASYPGKISGELTIKDKSYKDLSVFELSKSVGTVLQDMDGQFIGLSVGEDISFALENECVPYDELHSRVEEVSKIVDMDTFLSHAPHALSGGQKQRVSLAGVMVDNVDILLFDEPLANLDPKTGKTTIALIDEIHKKTNNTTIIIEHRLEDVLFRPVDRIILMGKGRIIADTTPDELLSSSLLLDNGIREPLYVTALKYAGVEITKEKKPGLISTLNITEKDKDKVRTWFKSIPREEKVENRDILLETKNITFSYDGTRNALENIDFYIHKGEMMSIVGKNGAGKSTFSKILCGFEKQNNGLITLYGKDIKDESIKERADHIGYVMQNPNQMISQTLIRDEIELGLKMKGIDEEERHKRSDEVMKICGLYSMRSWPISALSFGQKKRVTIASILVMNPDLIILDEPTAGQDFRHYTDIMEFLKKLNSKGITIILITHDMHLMLEYSERAVVFTDGKKVADSSPEDILTDEELSSLASLKKTSLSDLANMCDLNETEFVRSFISYERENRR